MTDLRARIAKVLASTFCTLAENNPCPECTESELPVADAVIAELGLIRDPFSTVAFCRYVTQWEPNEQFRPDVETP
jgi:hypothetical protein